MVSRTLSRLAIRQADEQRLSPVGHSRLPRIHHDFGPGDSLGIYIDQRLPPISTLLGDLLPPPTQHQHYPSFPPPPLPSPVGASPSLFSAPYPSWSTLPPRAQSVSGHYPGYIPPSPALGPRRASSDCISAGIDKTPRSYSVPTRTPFRHRRASPDCDRQRRSTKDLARLRRSSSSDSNPDDHSKTPSTPTSHIPTPPNGRGGTKPPPRRKTKPTTTTTPKPENNNEPAKTSKRNNQPYTFEQEAFFVYHRVDLDLPWSEVCRAYMARWPAIPRSVSGLECAYYRTNAHLPVVAPDGGLVLVDLAEIAGGEGGGGAGGEMLTPPGSPGAAGVVRSEVGGEMAGETMGGDKDGAEEGEEGDAKREWYKMYRGVAYRTRQVKCSKARFPLMERFPEELVDERNDWVRPEHRAEARVLGE
ncbi:predicted protein [Chaetomium globosum CBS 148.51]|uniref:Uncharacterized protein n=1 Tax=Chaetomium globosum (strain ATCC 6205 / CBS 148.51 / DSM 1962 / NBRC 6347 / NRRL 1970) TaxID=306901 RepID=Q2HA98_CHAGB|nr:uncharacterized protein CHGG_02856 [Chaetomium globosum CBS 148.51]EAQ90921.1 predicted protein [Chaetomium globosum CBS 148.51]